MEILDAINRLDDHVHTAPEIPLTDSVRIEASLLQASVGVIRQHADRMWGSDRAGPVGELFEALEELEAMVASAKPVPLTDELRVNRDKLYEPLDRIRELLLPAVTSARGASSPWGPVLVSVATFDSLVDEAGRALLSRALKIDARELRDAAARVRLAATQNVGPPDGLAGPKFSLYAALDELDELARVDGTLKVAHGVMYDLVDRMRTAALERAATV
jgi:hypothetical protein